MDRQMPFVTELDPGTYQWCSCGESQELPFCDGSHSGTNLEPVEFMITEQKRVAICICQGTQNPPYCDGTHHSISA